MNYCISVVWHRGAQLVAAGVLLTAQVALITHLYFWVFLIFRLIMCNKGKGEGRGRSFSIGWKAAKTNKVHDHQPQPITLVVFIETVQEIHNILKLKTNYSNKTLDSRFV